MHHCWLQDANYSHIMSCPDPVIAALIVQCVNGKAVLDLAPDVAASFGKPRSAEREIAFMRAVNDMLRAQKESKDG